MDPHGIMISECLATLTVLYASGTRVPLERLECSEGRQTLGVCTCTAPDGKQQAKVEFLHQSLQQYERVSLTTQP
jgi:hypothetical protein